MDPKEAFYPTNLVCICTLSSPIDTFVVSELLTCTPVDYIIERKNSKGSRIKIPYFGVDGAIISVRFNGKSRGIRIGGLQLINSIATDLQCDNKNIHLKIASMKLQLCGALTTEMGTNAFNYCLEHIKMVNEHWKHFNTLTEMIKNNTISWLYSVLINDDKLNMFDDENVIKQLDNTPDNVDYRSAKFLSMFTYDYNTPELFREKIDVLLKITDKTCYSITPSLGDLKISNGIYNYNLGCKISLIDLCSGLYQLGYGVLYHNWSASKLLRIMIPLSMTEEDNDKITEVNNEGSTDEESPNTSNTSSSSLFEDDNEDLIDIEDITESEKKTKVTTKKIPAHRFQIYQSGAVRQTSPTPISVAYQIKCILMQDIAMVLKMNE